MKSSIGRDDKLTGDEVWMGTIVGGQLDPSRGSLRWTDIVRRMSGRRSGCISVDTRTIPYSYIQK